MEIRPGVTAPLWFLDGKNRVTEIDFAPTSEGLTLIGQKLAVLAESGAEKYQRGGKGPLDQIVLLGKVVCRTFLLLNGVDVRAAKKERYKTFLGTDDK